MAKKFLFITMLGLMVIGLLGLMTGGSLLADEETFTQNDWSGGVSSSTAVHPTNKTGWNKYSAKTSNVAASATGVKMNTQDITVLDDTDTDFSKGTLTNAEITGTGAAAKVGISGTYQDPFTSSLGQWANLPFTPQMNRNSPLVRAGNYLYSLWQDGGGSRGFMRWSIADEKWEMMADIPISSGMGAALAYDGSSTIYALVGCNRKDFYAYNISANTWTKKKDIPTMVGRGGALVAIPSLSRLYALCGNLSSTVYRYNIATDSWSGVESAPFVAGVGACLVVHPSQPYIYANAGEGSATFCRFDYNAGSNAWSTMASIPTTLSWDSEVCYPGSGDYIYAWNASNRWFGRYSPSLDTWESSWWPASPVRNVELPGLPFVFNSRALLYDPDGSNTELRLLGNFSYSLTLRFYPATKKWREESFPSPGMDGNFVNALYVDDGVNGPCIYYTPNYSRSFYRYYLNFTPLASNLTQSNQWHRLADVVFAGNNGGLGCRTVPRMAYIPGTNYIYCIQRYLYNGFSRYNITTKTWETLAAFPFNGCRGGVIVAANGLIYATGGRNFGATDTSTFYSYDPQTNTWTQLANCTYGNFFCGATGAFSEDDGYIYFFRCLSNSNFMRYKIANNTWEIRASVPSTIPINNNFRGPVLLYPGSGNKLYYLTLSCCAARNYMGIYNKQSNQWVSAGYTPVKFYAAVATPTEIIAFSSNEVYRYNLSTDNWVNPATIYHYASSRYLYGSVVQKDDFAYLFMNYYSGYAWKYSISQKRWVDLIKLPFLTLGYGHKATYPGSGDYIYVSEGSLTKNFWKYNTLTGAWTQLENCPYYFSMGARMVSSASGVYACPGSLNNATFVQFTDDGGLGSWVTLTNMIETITNNEGNGTAIVPSGSYKGVYMLRGVGTTTFTKFNMDNQTWSYLQSAPWVVSDYVSLYYPGTGNFLYCAKGGSQDFAKYDLATNTWTILTQTSLSVNAGSAAFYPGSGDVIYYYLGTGHGAFGANFNRYSISQNKWDEPVQFPAANNYGSQICMMPSGEDLFYIPGGASTSAYKYNIPTSVWYSLNTAPIGIYWDAKVVYPGTGDDLYITRGDGYYDFWKYNVSTDLWINLAPPPYTFSTGQAMASYTDPSTGGIYLFVIRGGSGTYFLRYSVTDNAWREMAVTPSPCTRGASLIYPGSGSDLYACPGGNSSAFWKYNITNNTWTTVPSLPMPNMGGTLFTPGFGDYIYYFVSYTYSSSYGSPYFYRYSISQGIWEQLPDMPIGFAGQANAAYPGTGDYIYLSGGYGVSSLMKYLLFSSGLYISDIKEIGNNAGFGNITWQDNGLGQIEVKVRTGKKADLSDATSRWSLINKVSKNSDLSLTNSVEDKDNYLQYYLRFFCYDFSQKPLLDSLTFTYAKYPLEETLTSSAYNTGTATNRVKSISWTPLLPTGTNLRFQVHTAKDNGGTPGTWGPWLGPDGLQQIPYNFDSAGEYANTSEVVVSGGTAKISKVLADYLYRQTVNIDNSANATAYTDCTIKIDIPTENIDFWSHVSSDDSDIRFTDSDGSTPLAYRVLGFSKSKKSATCWVTVPSIPANTIKNIYLLYGKSTATSESNSSLAESLIGTDFYGLMLGFFEIITADSPNRVYIDKLNVDGQVIASTYLDFYSVGEKKRYDDADLTMYHVRSDKPIVVYTSAVEPTSSDDDDWYVVSGNDLWLWCPANNYDGDVIITAYSDDTSIKITDYGVGDDTTTIGLDKGNFWFGWNKVDGRGEAWHVESTKPITVMAGLINHYEANEQIRSPDMKEYYFYCPRARFSITGYEDNTNVSIDNLDGTQGDFSTLLNKGQSYVHITSPPTDGISTRTYIRADKPISVVADHLRSNNNVYGKATIHQASDTLLSVGKQYYFDTGGNRYLRFVALEDGGTSITVTGDINPSPTYLTLGNKGSMGYLDLGGQFKNLQITSTKIIGVYSYSTYWTEGITPVFHASDFNYTMPTALAALEEPATSANAQLSGWQYKETIEIDNTQNDSSLTDFQILVELNTNHRYFWQHCLADGGDVRFVDSDDNTLLSYYQESFLASGKAARFWVKIPSISNTAKKRIYLYYGKSGVTSLSDGNSVFEFFDDFSGDLSKWDAQYANLVNISAIFGMDSTSFSVPAASFMPTSSYFSVANGTNNLNTDVTIPSGVNSGITYTRDWELFWPNGTLIDSDRAATPVPFNLKYGQLQMTAGPFMPKRVTVGQVINTLGGTFTNNSGQAYQNLKYSFTFINPLTSDTYNVQSTTFNIPTGTSTINNVSITLPVDQPLTPTVIEGMLSGKLYTWSWSLLDEYGNTMFSSNSGFPDPGYNIAVDFGITAGPTLPDNPFTAGSVRQISATMTNTSGTTLTNLYWRLLLSNNNTITTQIVNVVLPSGIIMDRTYEWNWELRWPNNNALVDSLTVAQPYTLRYGLINMTDGPFLTTKNVTPNQYISGLGGTFTNNSGSKLSRARLRFSFTDVDTSATFTSYSSYFDIDVGTTTVNSAVMKMPYLVYGHLYSWSWAVVDSGNNVIFDGNSAPSPLFGIACGFQIVSGPTYPTPPLIGGQTRQVTATFQNTGGTNLNSLIWRFTLVDTTQGGRTAAKVAHNGYLQAKVNVSPTYTTTTSVVWQTANKSGQHFFGICDPNAKVATNIGNLSYMAGFDTLLWNNGYFYDQSGNGYNTWSSQRTMYTATMWNTEKMTWTPHQPSKNITGKVLYALSSGDKIQYNAGFVAGPGLTIKPTIRSARDAVFIDKILIYKSATVAPYVGFIFSETANPTGMAVYYKTNPVVQPVLGVFYSNNLVDFTDVTTKPANTDIKYQVSCDGYNWYWWNGSAWTKVSGGFSQTNTALEIKNNLSSYLVEFPLGEFWFRAYLNSTDGINTPLLDQVTVTTSTSPTYYLAPSGSSIIFYNQDTVDDQWFQYKAFLNSVGQETPELDEVKVNYVDSLIQITAPNGGETLNAGQTTTITWNSQAIDGVTGKVKIQYSKDDGTSYTTIASNVANTGSYTWSIPDIPSQAARIKIISEDFSGVYDTSDASFRILALEVVSPNGGEIWEAGKQHGITWSASGTLLHDLTIKYSKDGGATWLPVSSNRPPSPPTYTWVVQNDPSDSVIIKIYDPLDTNITDISNNTFAIVPSPKITVSSPQTGDIWKRGLKKIISWTANQNWLNSTVDIEYSRDDFVSDIQTIATGVSIGTPVGNNPNDDINGSYEWLVPNAYSDSAKIRVTESALPPNRNGFPRDTQQLVKGISGAFTISISTISFSKPVSSDILIAQETFRITWLTDGYVSNDLLLEYTKDGTNWVTIAEHVSNEGKYYDWLVPQEAVGDNVIIRITDASNAQVTSSSATFKVLGYPTIKVLSPNGGDNLIIGEQFNITWKSWGAKLQQGGTDYQAIKISYSADNGTTWYEINNQQVNDGDYPWVIPDTETTQALIKVEDQNDPLIFDVSDANFNIMIPSITLTSPNGGESWYATGDYNITWTSRGYINPDSLKLEYSTDGVNWVLIKTGQANTGAYTWHVADINSASVRVRIADSLRSTVTDTSDNVFTIKPPTLTVDSPKGGEEWVAGIVNEIKWSSTGKEVGAVKDNINIQYSTNGGSSWTNVTTRESNIGQYLWLVPSTISNTCLVKIFDATRPATVGVSADNFKIVLPYIRVLSPNGGEVWPIGTTDKVITFRSVGDISNNLKIEYSKDNFTSDFHTIATGVSRGTLQEDDSYLGSYAWAPTGNGIPNDYSASVKVRVTDSDWPVVYDDSDDYFSIAYPIIKVTRPNGGELFTVSDPESITWTNTGSVGSSLKIEYSKDNFATAGILIADNVSNSGPDGSYSWTVANDVSTLVRVRITDKNRPAVWDKSDASFSILPVPVITIDAPNGGEIWRVGTNKDITWHDNGGVISNNLTLEYSVDSGNIWKPIASNVANSGKYTWRIPDDISSACMVRITDASRPTTKDTSNDAFVIAEPKITITSPNGGEIWAISDKAPVTWTTEGGVSDSLALEISCDGGATYATIATVRNTGSYTWEIKEDKVTVTSNAVFRIRDITRPATYDISDKSFTIDPLPTITITSPVGGETYVLGDTMNITWTWTGLSISDNLAIEMSVDNFITRQVVATGVANTGSYTWDIPESALTGSTLKLRITDGNRTIITDTSRGYFRIRGGFVLSSPNGGENWVAKSPQTISWTTRGSIPKINLDYTTNDGQTWSTIASGISNQNSYSWVLPDIKSNSVKVRISNQDDLSVSDVSDNTFNIIYATVKFNILDFDTYQHLSELSAEEPSTSWTTGYELASPVVRTATYPYGTYTTFFKKANFIDNSVTWTAPRQGTEPYVVTLYLESTASAQVTWEAIFTYSYAPADDSLSAVGSLQRKGKLVGIRSEERVKMGVATLRVYEPAGTTIRKELTALVNDSGMYVFPIYINTAFESGKVYPATLTIVYNDVNYTSTANIDVGSEKLQYEFFTQTAKQLATSVATIESAVAGGTAQTRADIEASRLQLISDIKKTEESVKTHVTNVLSTTESSLKAEEQVTQDLVTTAMKSEILNTESTIKSGDSLVIRYRTYTGLSPTIDVYNAKNVLEINKGTMKEVGTTGIYEYSVKFLAGWGKGDFTIVCSESTKGTLDALTLSVIDTDIVEVSSQVAAILGSTSGITDLKSIADALNAQFSIVESSLAQIGKNLSSEVKDVVNTSSTSVLDPVFNQLSNMAKQIKQIIGEKGVSLEKLYQVSADKKEDMVYLKNKTQELKAAMEINQKMVTNIANKPVTQTWYEYK
jgi:hypothetical protein